MFPSGVLSASTRTDSGLWEETQHVRLLVYSGCSKSQISLEFHSISRDDGACGVFNVLSRRRIQCFHTHSLEVEARTHTLVTHTLLFSMQLIWKHKLAQIIKINTLEAWHYAKETSHFFERNLIKNYWIISVYATFSLSSLLLIYYADEGYTSVVNLWMTQLPLKQYSSYSNRFFFSTNVHQNEVSNIYRTIDSAVVWYASLYSAS